MTKLVLGAQGIDTPRARMVVPDDMQRGRDIGMLGLAYPVIVKPNFEGSSKGIGDEAVARDPRALLDMLPRALRKYPAGVLVEEFIPGHRRHRAVRRGRGRRGRAHARRLRYRFERTHAFSNIYDYRLKSTDAGRVSVRCPPDLQRDVVARLRALTKNAIRTLGIREPVPRRLPRR